MDQDLLEKAELASAHIEPSELHGLVCGLAAAHPWHFALTDLVELAGPDSLADEESVRAFVNATLQQLQAAEIAFHPLLPEDRDPLPQRLGGLADWCAGFLSGFGAGVAGDLDIETLPEDVQEVLRDFASISGLDEEAEGERDEAAFMELYEYVRVAALLAFTLMSEQGSAADPSGGDGVVH